MRNCSKRADITSYKELQNEGIALLHSVISDEPTRAEMHTAMDIEVQLHSYRLPQSLSSSYFPLLQISNFAHFYSSWQTPHLYLFCGGFVAGKQDSMFSCPHFISLTLISYYIISSHLVYSHRISFTLISSHLIPSHLIYSHRISFTLISSHLISSHLI